MISETINVKINILNIGRSQWCHMLGVGGGGSMKKHPRCLSGIHHTIGAAHGPLKA